MQINYHIIPPSVSSIEPLPRQPGSMSTMKMGFTRAHVDPLLPLHFIPHSLHPSPHTLPPPLCCNQHRLPMLTCDQGNQSSILNGSSYSLSSSLASKAIFKQPERRIVFPPTYMRSPPSGNLKKIKWRCKFSLWLGLLLLCREREYATVKLEFTLNRETLLMPTTERSRF